MHSILAADPEKLPLVSASPTLYLHPPAGASPISAEVMMFLRVCFGCHVLEGYGMTETSCTISITRVDDPTIGHVGAPLPCCEVKLVDIPEMSYLTSDQPYPRCAGNLSSVTSASTSTCTADTGKACERLMTLTCMHAMMVASHQ